VEKENALTWDPFACVMLAWPTSCAAVNIAYMYLERREKWDQLFTLGSHVAKVNKVAEANMNYEIQAVRKRKKARA